MSTLPPWSNDRITGTPRAFSMIYHVAHVPHAIRYLEDGRIPARPIQDESVLTRTRIPVTWLSPNDWQKGSIYGSIQFEFDWSTLQQGKRLYWVETIRYGVHACRLLLTDRDPPIPLDLYDPGTADGPLRLTSGRWERHPDRTLEIILDASLSLNDCKVIDWVKHNHEECRLYPGRCRETVHLRAGAQVLAHLVAMGDRSFNPLLPQVSVDAAKNTLFPLARGLAETTGHVSPLANPQKAAAKGSLLLYSRGRNDDASAAMAAALSTKNQCYAAIEEIMGEHFAPPPGLPPRAL